MTAADAPAAKPDEEPKDDGRKALLVLLSVVFLNLIGFGVVIPLLPFYAQSFQAPAWQITLLFSAYSIGQFFGEPYWGRLSDRIGRRPVLIATIIGNGLCCVGMAFAPNIWIAFAVRLVGGMAAGNFSTIQAYVADVTPASERAGRMGFLGMAFNMGFIVGPALGGLLAHPEAGPAGFRLPLLVAAAVALASAVGVFLFVRESRARKPIGEKNAGLSQWEAVRLAFSHPVIWRVIVMMFVLSAAFSGIEATFGLWTQQKFDWGPKQMGSAFAVIGIVGALCQGLVSGRLSRRFGEAAVLTAGLVGTGLCMGLQPFTPSAGVMVVVMAFMAFFQSIAFPAVGSLIAGAADPDNQGAIMGVNMSSASLARMGGPLIGGFIYSGLGPDWPFFVGCAGALAAAMLGRAAARARGPSPA